MLDVLRRLLAPFPKVTIQTVRGFSPLLVGAVEAGFAPVAVQTYDLTRFGPLFGPMAEAAKALRTAAAAPAIPRIEDFFLPEEDEDEETTPSQAASPARPEPLRDFLLDDLVDELSKFQGRDSLNRLFWERLGYERLDEPLPERFLPESVASSLRSATVFAQHEGLYVLLAQAREGRFRKGVRRDLFARVAAKWPQAAVVFCDYTWRCAALGFREAGDEVGRFLRLAPAPGDVDRLATRLGGLRAHTAAGFPRPLTDLLGSYRRLFHSLPEDTEDREAFRDQPIDPGTLFLRGLGEFTLMSRDETLAMLRRLREIGEHGRLASRPAEYEACRKGLVQGHLRLVMFTIKRFGLKRDARSMSWPDLVQEGVLGLMAAIDGFDLGKGYRFSTYAVKTIKHTIQRAIQVHDRLIRIPSYLFREGNELPAEDWRRLTYLRPLPEDESEAASALADHRHLAPWQVMDLGELRSRLEGCLGALDERAREIVRLRFGLADGNRYTLKECGEAFELTRERVRQIVADSLARLRRHPEHEQLLSTL